MEISEPLLITQPRGVQAGGRITKVACNTTSTVSLGTVFTANKLTAIHAELLAVLANRLLPVGRLTTTPLVALVSPRLHRSTLRLRLVRVTVPRHRSTPRLRSEHQEAQASLQPRLTRLRLVRATAQRHRLIQQLRLARHTEQVTARPLRSTLTLRDPLVMQQAQVDQRPRTAIHQP